MKNNTLSHIIGFLIACSIGAPMSLTAGNVTFDGSLGSGGVATRIGSTFAIPQERGRTVGTNLFHSFSQFDLSRGEVASFTGSSVNNILARVTGGNPSNIDGTIQSTIPGANFYLMNPSGLLFGPHAALDLTGSFYATTADYLKFSDRDVFYADLMRTSLFVSVDPKVFGFLSSTPSQIIVRGSGSVVAQSSGKNGLMVNDGKNLSLIGGDINITTDENGNAPQIQAHKGRINLVSLSGTGELILTDNGVEFSNNQSGGDISINGKSDTDDRSVGNINSDEGMVFIRGGNLTMRTASIHAKNQPEKNKTSVKILLDRDLDIAGVTPIPDQDLTFDIDTSSSVNGSIPYLSTSLKRG
ncbi:MAG: filamentous hemagglutinin N-terminal domain-containing protein [Magnetococcales bacterium]|nr:filamentous hemagglutinin N-terminal domain-containing protein [Magnetococcales bacterium]